MIGGNDYILYTNKSYEEFIMTLRKELLNVWDNPYFVFDNEDNTTDIFISKNEEMFNLMDKKGFYLDKKTGEGPFLIMFNNNYQVFTNRVTIVLPRIIEDSIFCNNIFNLIKLIIN